jgi:hypothetical protein
MALENPIGKIRKAVEALAEQKAENEFLEKPETRHYEAVFEQFRAIKEASPEMLEIAVHLASNAKEMQDELGSELLFLYKKVASELDTEMKDKFIIAFKKLKDENLSKDDLEIKVKELYITGSKKVVDMFKNDPRIVSAFKGKEELLEKLLKFMEESELSLIDAMFKYQ